MSQSGGLFREIGMLFLSVIMGLFAGSLLAYIGVYAFFNIPFEEAEQTLSALGKPENAPILRWMQLSSTGFGFLIAALTYLQWNKNAEPMEQVFSVKALPNKQIFVFGSVCFVLLSPLVSSLQVLNQGVVFPELLAGLEEGLKAGQALMEQQIKVLIGERGGVNFFYLLLILALMPALGEELVFRVGLQSILQKHIGLHQGVWLASLIFALVHQQFYNLLPMIFLALLLGYTYAVFQSFWLNFTLHFVHNAYTLITVYYLGIETERGLIENYLPTSLNLVMAFAALGLLVYYLRSKYLEIAVK